MPYTYAVDSYKHLWLFLSFVLFYFFSFSGQFRKSPMFTNELTGPPARIAA